MLSWSGPHTHCKAKQMGLLRKFSNPWHRTFLSRLQALHIRRGSNRVDRNLAHRSQCRSHPRHLLPLSVGVAIWVQALYHRSSRDTHDLAKLPGACSHMQWIPGSPWLHFAMLLRPCSRMRRFPGWQAATEPLTTKNRLHILGVKSAPPHVHPPVHGGVHDVRLLHLLCPSGAALGVLGPKLSAWRSEVSACCKQAEAVWGMCSCHIEQAGPLAATKAAQQAQPTTTRVECGPRSVPAASRLSKCGKCVRAT